jgi:hypothetical protein
LIGSLVGQSFAGLHQFNADAVTHSESTYTWLRYVTSSEFGGDVMENWQSEFLQFSLYILSTVWLLQRGFRNWQSEFLAIGSMAVFTIYLRQRGSPESKAVGAPHDATGIAN